MVITFNELWNSLPDSKQTDEVFKELKLAYLDEVSRMADYAIKCEQPEENFFAFQEGGEQSIAHFNVKDLGIADDPQKINMHFQNVSQWRYAGGIVVQNGKVSRHH